MAMLSNRFPAINSKILYRFFGPSLSGSSASASHSTVSRQKTFIEENGTLSDTVKAQETGAVATQPSVEMKAVEFHDPAYDKLDLSFENAAEAYRSKTNLELVRAYAVFQLCSFKYVVEHNKQVSYY